MNMWTMSVDELERNARELSGLSDFGDSHYRAGLIALVESLNLDGPLHEAGRTAMFNLLTLRLAARLKLIELLKRSPDVGRWKTHRASVFVVGTLRSGTTFLYNLLSLDPKSRSPQLWETIDPIPPATLSSPEDVQARISAMEQFLKTYNENLPQLAKIHCFHSPTQVEECSGLLEPTFKSPSLAYLLWGGETYYRWLANQPSDSIIKAYLDYRSMVAALMYGHDECFWLSKCPLYAPHVPEIAEVFPNAHFIHAHRDPRERIPSACSLLKNFQAVYTDPRAENVAKQVLFYNDQAMQGIERGRRELQKGRTIDVQYEDLIADPLRIMGDVYDSLGMEFTAGHQDALVDWASNRNPYDPNRIGKHRYSSREFGLDDAELSRMAP